MVNFKKYRTFFKLQRRMISKTKSRFISVLIITLIGTSVYAGLRISPEVMRQGADAYYDKQDYADLTLIPTYGVTDEDVEKIKHIEGIKDVETSYFSEGLLKVKDQRDAFSIYSQSKTANTTYLVEGRNIQSDDECVIDELYFKQHQLKLGDKVTLENKQGQGTYKIVGVGKDVRYLVMHNRGTSEYGNGTCRGFIYLSRNEAKRLSLNKDLIDLFGNDDFYNQLFIHVDGAKELNVYSDAYEKLLNEVEIDLNDYISIALDSRYEALIKDKKEQLKGPLDAYHQGLHDYEVGQKQMEVELKEAKIALVQGKLSLIEGKQQLLEAQGQATDGVNVDDTVNGLLAHVQSLKDDLKALKEDLNQIENGELPEVSPPPTIHIEDIHQLIDQMNQSVDAFESSIQNMSSLADGILQLEASKLQLEKATLEIENGENLLYLKEEEAKQQLTQAKNELDEAKVKLDEAQALIDEIPKPQYFILDQSMNEGIVNFQMDSDRIDAIARVFPLMFFLVAALVSLTTMTRMVEEQRGQTGVLRALGYSRLMIIMQYVTYAFMATMIGAIIGIIFGSYFFPLIIYGLYCYMMYDIPIPMIYTLDLSISLQALFISVIVTLSATLMSCVGELRHVPSVLMRPKPPKLGKRIFLEKIPAIWNHLNFNQKVTMRNIFRYKKRFFMSLVGIMGCTALTLVGFGIKYSVADISTRQFEDLCHYDSIVSYETDYTSQDIGKLKSQLQSYQEVDQVLFANYQNIDLSYNNNHNQATMITPITLNRFDHYFTLRDIASKEEVTLANQGCLMTEKLSELLDVGVGDKISLSINDETYEIEVAGIIENYIGHYIYLSPTYYETLFNHPITINSSLLKLNHVDAGVEDRLGKALMDEEGIMSASFNFSSLDRLDKQMQSLDIIVWVLIICAGLLAFVVLYNLTNININERIGEIATIKVLGFRRKEVYDYVFRENIILSLIASLLGLVFGTWLHRFIILTVEVDLTMFVRTIRPISYLYAVFITMTFTYIINYFMRSFLNKIDMISSLKSVE